MAATRDGGQERAVRRVNYAEALCFAPLGKCGVFDKLKDYLRRIFSCGISSATVFAEALQPQTCLNKASDFSRGPGLRIFVMIGFPCKDTDQGVGWQLADDVLHLKDVVRIWQQNRERGADSQLLVYTDAGKSRLLSLESAMEEHDIYVQSSAGANFTDNFVSSQTNEQGVLKGLHAWGFWPMYATPKGQDRILQGETENMQLLGTSAKLELDRHYGDQCERSVLREYNCTDVHVLSLSNPGGWDCQATGQRVEELKGAAQDFEQFTTVLHESGCRVHRDFVLGPDLTVQECINKIGEFFKLDGLLLILAWIGHGSKEAQGAWQLRDGEMPLGGIVDLWRQREQHQHEQHQGPPRARLLIFMDSCYSGCWSKLAARHRYPIYIQSSCQDTEAAWDGGEELDTFTSVFIKYHRCELRKDEVPRCLARLACRRSQLRRMAAMHPCYYAPENSPHIFQLPDRTLFFLMGDHIRRPT